MDCSDFLRLAQAFGAGEITRYACAVFEWHRRTCPRCAAATTRTTPARPVAPVPRRGPAATR